MVLYFSSKKIVLPQVCHQQSHSIERWIGIQGLITHSASNYIFVSFFPLSISNVSPSPTTFLNSSCLSLRATSTFLPFTIFLLLFFSLFFSFFFSHRQSSDFLHTFFSSFFSPFSLLHSPSFSYLFSFSFSSRPTPPLSDDTTINSFGKKLFFKVN